MREIVCQFGPTRQLSGIITEPAGMVRVGFVLVSAGLVPKYGPYRLYTVLARHLATLGVASLRFDLSGVGDSGPEFADQPLRVRTDLEITGAVDALCARYSLTSVTIGGLCSGAEDSFRYSVADERVKGVCMIDPFAYPTQGSRRRDFLRRAQRRGLRWLGIYRPLHRPRGQVGDIAEGGGTLVDYQYMARQESTAILERLLARKVRLQFLYTGGGKGVFNHRGQLRKMFPTLEFGDLVDLDFLPGMDHTQELDEDRRVIVAAIARWQGRHFAGGSG